MKIQGLQKMTLLDYPGHVACTVFLGGCDFRCPFCHNFDLVVGPMLEAVREDEFFAFLDKRHGLLDGVAITGGEPCLRSDLPDFMARIRESGFLVKLDTNGYHPAMLRRLIEGQLVDYVAMDVKNSPGKYARTAGVERVDLDAIAESIRLIMDGAPDYEFRTTVVHELHEADDFHAMGKMIAGAKAYFLQSFTDRDTVPFAGLSAPSADDLAAYAGIARLYVPNTQVRGVD